MRNELSESEAAVVKALTAKRYKNHDIASWYGVNPRAISHVKNGVCYSWVKPNFDHGISPRDLTTRKADVVNQLNALKRKLGDLDGL